MFEKRNLALVALGVAFTFGIYPIYWIVQTQNAIKSRFGVGFSGGKTIVVWIITLGIYGFIWHHHLGTVCDKMSGKNIYGVIFLILCFTGFGSLINLIIAQWVINNSVDRMNADGAM